MRRVLLVDSVGVDVCSKFTNSLSEWLVEITLLM